MMFSKWLGSTALLLAFPCASALRLQHDEDAVEEVAPIGQDARGTQPMLFAEARTRAWNTISMMTKEDMLALVRPIPHKLNKKNKAGFYTGTTKSFRKLNIPALKMMHGSQGYVPLGFEEGNSTQFPCLLGLASTWDENLVYSMAAAIGEEFKGKGSNVMLGPSIDVQRVPQNGRSFESLSGEDPILGAALAKSFVDGVHASGVMPVVKSWGFSPQETNKELQNVEIDDRTAWELYYPPFVAAVKAGVAAIMCASSEVNSTYACMNSDLLKRDLKDGLDFRGMIMSDGSSTNLATALGKGLDQAMPLVGHRNKRVPDWHKKWTAEAKQEALAKAFNKQGAKDNQAMSLIEKDIALPNNGKGQKKSKTKRSTSVPTDDFDLDALQEATKRVLMSIYRLRLHEDQQCVSNCMAIRTSNQKSSAHSDVARRVATDAVILLKNDAGVLPLTWPEVKKVVVLGSVATAQPIQTGADYYSGGGSSKVPASNVVTPLEGISAHAGRIQVIDNVAEADVCVVVAGATSSEGADRANLHLDNEAEIESASAQCRKTVVLMQTPGAVVTPWRSKVHAIANLFLGGEETANAWGAILFGHANPGGKLPISFPEHEEDVIKPSADVTVPTVYGEKLATSYRVQNYAPAFAFGHGLSYTSFAYTDLHRKEGCSNELCFIVTIRNIGTTYAGREVVQAYLKFDDESLGEPPLLLKSFKKTKLLQPGQAVKVFFTFQAAQLGIWQTGKGWVPQRRITFFIGSSSRDLRANITAIPRGL